MRHLKALAIATILLIIFLSGVLILVTKIVIPAKLDIGKSLEVPDVTDMDLTLAKEKLISSGFVFEDSLSIEWIKTPKYPDRTVISQFPNAGKLVKNKNRIKLEVSSGGQLVVLPLVLEENAINASSRLKQLGLKVKIQKKNYGLYEQNSVVEVIPEVGSKILKGSEVVLIIESETVEEDATSQDSLSNLEINSSSLEDILNNN